MLDGAGWANKLVQNASADKFAKGVQGTEVDPAQEAVKQQGAMVTGWNESVNSGRWAANLLAAGGNNWKQKTAAKSANYTTGLNAAKQSGALAQIGGEVMANAAQVKAAVRNMPKGQKGGGESMARINMAMQMMMQFKANRVRRR